MSVYDPNCGRRESLLKRRLTQASNAVLKRPQYINIQGQTHHSRCYVFEVPSAHRPLPIAEFEVSNCQIDPCSLVSLNSISKSNLTPYRQPPLRCPRHGTTTLPPSAGKANGPRHQACRCPQVSLALHPSHRASQFHHRHGNPDSGSSTLLLAIRVSIRAYR